MAALTPSESVGSLGTTEQEEPTMIISFAPVAQPQNSGPTTSPSHRTSARMRHAPSGCT
jgi:hypothetical protein